MGETRKINCSNFYEGKYYDFYSYDEDFETWVVSHGKLVSKINYCPHCGSELNSEIGCTFGLEDKEG